MIYILSILFCKGSFGQSFLNGSFENNTAVVDQINLLNTQYNSFMSNSVGFGILSGSGLAGNLDIITSFTYCGGAQNGNWFVALTGGGSDAFSLELSSSLILGNSYSISFYDRSCSPYPAGNSIQIGVSNTNNNFGSLVYTAPPPTYNGGWSLRTFSFVAPINGLYITVKCNGPNSGQPWTQVDNFSFPCLFNLNLGNDTTLCPGQSIILNGGAASSHLWSNGLTSSSINVSSSGTYWLQASNGQCSATDSITISINQYPTLNLGNDTTLCQGQMITLDGDSATSYLWSNGSTAGSINVSSLGTYWLQENIGQCSTSDTLSVKLFNCEIEIELPNIFTPNGDGVNDIFIPIKYKGISNASLIIYNRWGENLFSTDNLILGWNGTYKDNNCSDGTYFWIVKYKTMTDESKELKGILTIIK